MRRPLPLTDADLRASWADLVAVRAEFPATFEAAMADQMAHGLIRIHALQQAQRRVQAALLQRSAPAPARRNPAFQHHHQVDHKRAAAGDRDDD